MNLPIELIKYGLLAIVGVVMCFKVFEFTKRIVKKWKNKDDDSNFGSLDIKEKDIFDNL